MVIFTQNLHAMRRMGIEPMISPYVKAPLQLYLSRALCLDCGFVVHILEHLSIN